MKWKLKCSMRTDIMKLLIAFRNFANTPKENSQYGCQITRLLQMSEHSFWYFYSPAWNVGHDILMYSSSLYFLLLGAFAFLRSYYEDRCAHLYVSLSFCLCIRLIRRES